MVGLINVFQENVRLSLHLFEYLAVCMALLPRTSPPLKNKKKLRAP
jgi:hypothetical protein